MNPRYQWCPYGDIAFIMAGLLWHNEDEELKAYNTAFSMPSLVWC